MHRQPALNMFAAASIAIALAVPTLSSAGPKCAKPRSNGLETLRELSKIAVSGAAPYIRIDTKTTSIISCPPANMQNVEMP
jgi:hypothetical protein